jgi:U3 small nucleolar RNA-associated protein MPP10
LPPTITKETTTSIESVIKQRILDELFDDPIRKQIKGGKNGKDEDQFEFTKSKKGLGDVYEDEYRKKLLEEDPNAFLNNEFTGVDSSLKKEIDQLMKGLFY